MSVDEQDVITQQVIVKAEVEWRDEIIARHEKGVEELNRKLDALTETLLQKCKVVEGRGGVLPEELMIIKKELVVEVEDHVKKLVEQQQPARKEVDSQVIAELMNMKSDLACRENGVKELNRKVDALTEALLQKDLVEEIRNLRTLVEQQAPVLASSDEVKIKDVVGVEVVVEPASDWKDIEMNKTAKSRSPAVFRGNIAAEVDALVRCLEESQQIIISRDLIIESKEKELKDLSVNFALVNEEVIQLRKQIEIVEIEINDKRKIIADNDVELGSLRSNVEAKGIEVNNLEVLLEQTKLKLEERQKHITKLEEVALDCRTLVQHIKDEKQKEENSSKTENAEAKSVVSELSSLAGKLMQHIEKVNARETSEESNPSSSDMSLPGDPCM